MMLAKTVLEVQTQNVIGVWVVTQNVEAVNCDTKITPIFQQQNNNKLLR